MTWEDQQAISAFADTLPDGVVVVDPRGKVMLVSGPAAQMLGLEDPEQEGRDAADVLRLTDSDGNLWLDCHQPFSALRTVNAITEQSWFTEAGTELLVSGKLNRETPLGEVTTLVVVLRSGRGRERLDRDRSDLVATVAHELRSPLTGVKGFVKALTARWDKLTDEQKQLMLATISADADRLARLIAELLDVARIDTGRLQLYPRPSDPAELVRRVVESVSVSTSRSIELTAGADLPKVLVDPDKFTQVITNLVENAVRHGKGTVRVEVQTEAEHVWVQVSDQGAGIPPELRKRVFTKFWRTGQRGGSGLGLYLVNGLVKAQGGEVVIGDAPGGGATMRCTWPQA